MIDTGRIDPKKPIDLAAIANTKLFPINPDLHHFGVNLTVEVFLKMGQTQPSFCLFSFFSPDKYSTNLTINDKSIDCVLGAQT